MVFFLIFLSASTLSVLDYYQTPRYSDLYKTVLNYLQIVLGTRTPEPCRLLPILPQDPCGLPSPRAVVRGKKGTAAVGSRRNLPSWGTPLPVSLSPPFNSPGDIPRTRVGNLRRSRTPGTLGRRLPRPAIREGSRGQTGPAPRHAYFLPPACADANSGVHKTGLHQTDQPPSSPRYYPRHKPWQKAAAKASADRPNNSGDKGLFCQRRWHKSDAITPARLQLAPYLFI